MAAFFSRVAGLKTFLLALVLYLVFGAYVMPHGASTINSLTPPTPGCSPLKIMDLQFTGYSYAQAQAILNCYSSASLQYAARFTLVADSLYPWAYTFIYLITLAWIFKNIRAAGKWLPYILLIPLLTMLLDYCENSCLIMLMQQHPNYSQSLVSTASAFTVAKWLGAGLQTLLLLGGLVWLGITKTRANS